MTLLSVVARLLTSLLKVEQKFRQMALGTTTSSLIRIHSKKQKWLRSHFSSLLLTFFCM